MNIAVRADSSITIGSGHIMRCLTLADLLIEKGHNVYFICRDIPGNMGYLLAARGYPVSFLPGDGDFNWLRDAEKTAILLANQKFDWLVADHYQIDEKWETFQRRYVRRIMAIDDLADRKHDCDLLLDQNYYQNLNTRYDGLISSNCHKLLGPRYVLLRKEFIEARKKLKPRSEKVERILVFLGGSDPDNITAKVLKAFELFDYGDIAIDVVVGGMNPYREQIEINCKMLKNAHYYCQVENMASLMAEASLAVGAGGTVTWERCYLGLPSITVTIADNQLENTAAVALEGATLYLGPSKSVSAELIASAIEGLLSPPAKLSMMSKKALSLMGDTHFNVAEEMELLYNQSN